MKLNHNKKSVKISLNLFALYAVMVCGIVFALPAFAADDPLVVVENLSTFIFSLIRAVGLILLGWGIPCILATRVGVKTSAMIKGMLMAQENTPNRFLSPRIWAA